MPVKIRLARHGKKGYAYYSIVVADSRAPRDGRFIEKIGTYNPNTNPAQIDVKFDRALYWVQTGAQPTDTCRTLLSKKGVLLKDHLLRGVAKKALTEAQADAKFNEWLKNKENKINAVKAENEGKKKADDAKRLEAESKVKEAKLAEINKKKAEAEAAANAAKAEAEAAAQATEATADESKAE